MKMIRILFLTLVLVLFPFHPAKSATAEHACICLVLDNSGSMADNDPGFMRNTGAKLLISTLDDGDQVGIVHFSTHAVRFTPELVTLATPQDKLQLIELLEDLPPDGYTDIRAAIKEAIALLQNTSCEQRAILVLSDGKPELPGGIPANYAVTTLELVQNADIPILGIALTPGGESGLLYQLAKATDPPGKVIPARTASDLLDAYLEAIAQLKDRTVVGSGYSSSPGFSSLSLEAGLPQYVSRVTYIVSKPENITAHLVAPGGETISPDDPRLTFSYVTDPRFAAYTVDSPAPGDWGFELAGTGQVQARAILRSRLRVSILQPAMYHPLGVPLPLAVSLIEEKPDGVQTTLIGEGSVSAVFIRPDGSQDSLDQLFDDGSRGDILASDGVFTNEYVKTDLPGEYKLTIVAYKGLIPVQRSMKFVVVPFPQIIPISPERDFEFRAEPMTVAMNLEGGDPPTLDASMFIARINGPGGSSLELSLSLNNNELPYTYSASFVPPDDGIYTIEFLPVDASYKGVPYTLSAMREVNVRLIPTINIAESQLDLGVIEAAELSRGLSVKLNVTSSSKHSEIVGFNIADLPGLSVTNVSPKEILAGNNQVYLTLKGDLLLQEHRPTLMVSAREGVDLLMQEIPLSLTVYQPALTIEPTSVDLGEVRVDKFNKGQAANLSIASSSLRDEPLHVEWQGPQNIQIQTEVNSLMAGKTTDVMIKISADDLPEGTYSGQIIVSSREGVLVTPGTVDIELVVVPVSFCSRWCLPLGGGGVVLALATAASWSMLSSRDRLAGSLKAVKVPAGQVPPTTILLSPATGFLNPGQVIIGSGSGAAIQLPGGNVRPKHAAIKANRRKVTERIGKPARNIQVEKRVNLVQNLGDGVVKVNNVTVPKGQFSVPLRTGMKVQVGEYEFEYHE